MTQAPIRGVLGQRGYGKSTRVRELVQAAPRVVAFDSRREHQCLTLDYPAFCAYVDEVLAPQLPQLMRFRLGLAAPGDGEEVEHLCLIAWELGERLDGRGLLVLLEEADLIAAPGQEPPGYKRLASQGRHLGIEIAWVTRRPSEVSRHLTSQTDELTMFRIQEPRDVAYIRSMCGAEVAEAVSGLQRFQYVRWTAEGGWDGSVAQLAVPGGNGRNILTGSAGSP